MQFAQLMQIARSQVANLPAAQQANQLLARTTARQQQPNIMQSLGPALQLAAQQQQQQQQHQQQLQMLPTVAVQQATNQAQLVAQIMAGRPGATAATLPLNLATQQQQQQLAAQISNPGLTAAALARKPLVQGAAGLGTLGTLGSLTGTGAGSAGISQSTASAAVAQLLATNAAAGLALPKTRPASAGQLASTTAAFLAPPQPQQQQQQQPDDTTFTQEDMDNLRLQIAAYRYIARKEPLPELLKKALFEPGSVGLDQLDLGGPSEMDQPMTPASDSDKGVVKQQTRAILLELEEQKARDREAAAAEAAKAPPSGAVRAPAAGTETLQSLGKLFPQVRVTRESNPYLLLRKKMTTAEHAALAHRILIPSVTPTGIDVAALAEERERYVRARILNRLGELENAPGINGADPTDRDAEGEDEIDGEAKPASESSQPKDIKALIELKALRLVDKQKRLREEIVQGMAKATQLATAADRATYRRLKKHSIREIRGTDKMEKTQRVERQKKEKVRQHEFIASIVQHGKDLFMAHKTRETRMGKLGQTVIKLHSKIEKEELARLEVLSKERLRALREDDEEAYLKLVQESKNTRIVHILGQTTAFLKNLTNQVIAQKESVGEVDGVPGAEDGMDEDDEDLDDEQEEAKMAANKDYYGVAHRIKELVERQPDMLVGGELKEYQLKGLQWMVSLYNNRLNGILADEMGLGKTIQVGRIG